MAHEDAGQALWVADAPPARHVAQVRVADGQRVAWATGRARCGIDRAVTSVALAAAFDAQGVGVLGLLVVIKQAGVERWAAP